MTRECKVSLVDLLRDKLPYSFKNEIHEIKCQIRKNLICLISFNIGIPLDRELFLINNGMRCLQLLTAASVNHVCIFFNGESHLS